MTQSQVLECIKRQPDKWWCVDSLSKCLDIQCQVITRILKQLTTYGFLDMIEKSAFNNGYKRRFYRLKPR